MKNICKHCGSEFPYFREKPYCSSECYTSAGRGPKIRSVAERFWAKVVKRGPDDCWLWSGATHQYGYGRMSTGSRKCWTVVETHCISWELHHGPIPDGLHVRHRCDNPPCVNPAHLFLGTNNDNRQDSVRKKRHAFGDRVGAKLHPETVARGERSGTAKLTANAVREIRRAYEKGESNQRELAKRFCVTQSNINMIVARKAWRHIA